VDAKEYCAVPVVCCDSVLGVLSVARPEEYTFIKDELDLPSAGRKSDGYRAE